VGDGASITGIPLLLSRGHSLLSENVLDLIEHGERRHLNTKRKYKDELLSLEGILMEYLGEPSDCLKYGVIFPIFSVEEVLRE